MLLQYTEYSTLLDSQESMQIYSPFKHNNNKTINISQWHKITNYTQNNKKVDTANSRSCLK